MSINWPVCELRQYLITRHGIGSDLLTIYCAFEQEAVCGFVCLFIYLINFFIYLSSLAQLGWNLPGGQDAQNTTDLPVITLCHL